MIRIVIAEDQRMLRGALSSLLDLEDDMEVVGQASNGEEVLALMTQLKPDVCLMDIEMPIKSGLQVAEELKQQQELASKVVILTTFARPGYFERAVKAGVQGYLLKDGPSEKLAESIWRVMQGHREVSPELLFGVVGQANPLFLSAGTVRNYLSEIFAKLEAKNRIEAITIAEEKGWL